MGLVRITDDGLNLLAVSRAGGFPFFNQFLKRLFADDRINDFFNNAIGVRQRSICHFKEQAMFPGDAFQVLNEFPFHFAFGLGADTVDDADQQIQEIVRQLVLTQIAKNSEECKPYRRRMAAKFIRFFYSDALVIIAQGFTWDILKEVFRQTEGAQAFQPGYFFKETFQTGAAWPRAKVLQRGPLKDGILVNPGDT